MKIQELSCEVQRKEEWLQEERREREKLEAECNRVSQANKMFSFTHLCSCMCCKKRSDYTHTHARAHAHAHAEQVSGDKQTLR